MKFKVKFFSSYEGPSFNVIFNLFNYEHILTTINICHNFQLNVVTVSVATLADIAVVAVAVATSDFD